MSEQMPEQQALLEDAQMPFDNFYLQSPDTSEQSTGFVNRLRNRWSALVAASAAALAVSTGLAVDSESAYAAENETAVVGMPFDGKWAYSGSTKAPCGPESNQTSHPSCHEIKFGDWATDLYAAADAPVKLHVEGDGLRFTWDTNASGSCGQTRRVNVYSNDKHLGRVHFTHLKEAASTEQQPTNGMTLGKIANLSCNPGGNGKHIHVEFDNASGGHSCYHDYSTNEHTAGMRVHEGSRIGILGSSNTGTKQKCEATSELPTSTPSRPAAVARSATDMDVFYRDTNNNLRNIGWNAALGWGIPTIRVHGVVTGNPDAVARSNTDMDVFFVDNHGRLENIGWNASTGWGVATVRAYNVAGDPSVIARSPTDMDIFYRDTNNNLVNVGWNAFTGWGVPTVRSVGDVRGNPSAAARGDGAMEVVYKDYNNNLRSIGWSALHGWGAATTRVNGANISGDPEVVSRNPTDLEAFYRTGSDIHSIGWNAAGGWGNSTFKGGAATGDPSATARDTAAMETVYQGSNNNLMTIGWNSTYGWGAATARTNGAAIGKPDIVSRSPSSMDIFFEDQAGYIKNVYWDASKGWDQTSLPGTNDIA